MDLSRLALSALHERERSGKRRPVTRPSQTYNADCPERGAVEIVISLTQEENEARLDQDSDEEPEDDEITELSIVVKAPVWRDKKWKDYVDTFRPLIFEGLKATYEYVYNYTKQHADRPLEFSFYDCFQDYHNIDNTASSQYVASRSGFPEGYEIGHTCHYQWFPPALLTTEAFKTMCEIAIDRMSGLPTKVLRAPEYVHKTPFELAVNTHGRGAIRQRSDYPWFWCHAFLCVGDGLGYVDPDTPDTSPEFTFKWYRAIERHAHRGARGNLAEDSGDEE